jgi:hypothetical protein
LPDAVFFKTKIPLWEILEVFGMEKVGILFGHLVI